jgi:hypothetical protein
MRNVLGLEDWASNWRDLAEALDLVPAPVGEPLVVMWFAELEEEVDTEALSLLVLRIWKIARVTPFIRESDHEVRAYVILLNLALTALAL